MFTSKKNVIFREGDIGNSFFWIQSGEVSVYRNYGNENETCLSVFSENDYFGEMAVIDNNPRSATAVTTEDTELIEIKIDNIKDIIASYPNVLESFIKTLTQRIRNINNNYIDACKTISQMTLQLENKAKIQGMVLAQRIAKYTKVYEQISTQYSEKSNYTESK